MLFTFIEILTELDGWLEKSVVSQQVMKARDSVFNLQEGQCLIYVGKWLRMTLTIKD